MYFAFVEFIIISFWQTVKFKSINSLRFILFKFLVLYIFIYLKFSKPLNILIEFSIFSKLKLEISKASNFLHPKKILSILINEDELKSLKSIDIIFWALLSKLESKNFSRLVTEFLRHNFILVFFCMISFSFALYILLSLKINKILFLLFIPSIRKPFSYSILSS